jgi:capsular exopolysaccharide synthesis family protein
VLLIDADLRCPKMHLLNGLQNSFGLSTLLTGGDPVDEALQHAIQENINTNLDILPSGPKVPNPANLFSSVEMRGLLERVSEMYAYVIIDSPPVLYFADSVILSTGVEAVVLVARANQSSHEVLARARKRMQDVHANILGLVINDVPLTNYQYYNNHYYQQLEAGEPSESGDILNLR